MIMKTSPVALWSPLKIRVLHRKHSRDTLENVYHPFGVCRATQAADDRLGSRIQSCHRRVAVTVISRYAPANVHVEKGAARIHWALERR